MVTFEIDGNPRSGTDITPEWIVERFRAAGANGNQPCVRVEIDAAECKMALQTPVCANAVGSGGREPNACEDKVFVLWNRNHLNTSGYSPGNLIAFLKQLQQMF